MSEPEDILDRIKSSDRDAVWFRSPVQVLANEAAAEIASLRARLEEAEKDSERLDFVCEESVAFLDDESPWEISFCVPRSVLHPTVDVRKAIDAALEESRRG